MSKYSSIRKQYEKYGEDIFTDLRAYLRPKHGGEKPYSDEYIRTLQYKIKNRLWYLLTQTKCKTKKQNKTSK